MEAAELKDIEMPDARAVSDAASGEETKRLGTPDGTTLDETKSLGNHQETSVEEPKSLGVVSDRCQEDVETELLRGCKKSARSFVRYTEEMRAVYSGYHLLDNFSDIVPRLRNRLLKVKIYKI